MGTSKKITLDEYATTLIRLKARQLIGQYGFSRSDREDLEQELTLNLLIRLSRFDPSKGQPATFVRMVVDRRVASLIRERKSLSRDYRRARHLLDEISDEIGDGSLTEPAVDDQHERDLAMDMAEALDTLSDVQRSIAESLRDAPLTEVARKHHCSREAMRRHAEQVRRHLARRGLDQYIAAHQTDAAPRK
ncbi:MAG: sigma-70 family RNA polymerase sigma factor [Phycisphaerales bacterium]|nr:sigma-70 family RNA polymerase sigma factor [Phycisphaerales bacterium]